ncbi:hypothetical protein [Natrialbaceae archaeon AArc-T1-2]|uniref:EMC6-like membrane protein n=1 Tax=Natrialbaceae archaeon AArc-T1-2 TaxID=3053904 RepID=UPI00255B1E9E|nr:hypothetical protein [Natrialbaceae archaeon AArc-T1-2]WIV65765.1 hypothetical protein QQ977_08600 [Natrialbaceae archaeon AArc-T1-2]
MSTESMSDRREHVRSVGVTALSALIGVGAALLSAAITADAPTAEAAATDTTAYIVVFTAIIAQFPLLQLTGVYDDEEFGPKHYLFLTFMTFSLWFVVWGILLTVEYGG